MIDFAEIISTTDRYNFHSHTQFCDGRADMSVMAEAAVKCGMLHWGFSPHSPVPIESSCNMSADDVAAYVGEVQRLKTELGSRIKLYTSMEIDYLGDEWGPSHSYFDTIPLDYRIGSVHFLPCGDRYVDVDGRFDSFKTKMDRFFDNDIRHVVETFYRQSVNMVKAGGFDIIGHFDKIGHNASMFAPGIEDEEWYIMCVDRLVDAVIESGVAVEINTKVWEGEQRIFPSFRYLPRLIENGVTIVVNSDAHYPDKVDAGRADVIGRLVKMIDNCKN